MTPRPTLAIDRRSLFGAAIAALVGGGRASAQACRVQISVDYHGWAGLDGWAAALKPQLAGWWRDINRALGAAGCRADQPIRLEFYRLEPAGFVAAARGDSVFINAPYVLANRDNPDMFRMVAHELVHVAQDYPPGARPAWLREGIADYVRYYVLFPKDGGRAFDPGREDWREGYSPAAGLLAWAEARRTGVVAKVNAAMRRGEAGDAALAAATGMPPEALWKAYLASHPDAASAEKRRAYWQGLKRVR